MSAIIPAIGGALRSADAPPGPRMLGDVVITPLRKRTMRGGLYKRDLEINALFGRIVLAVVGRFHCPRAHTRRDTWTTFPSSVWSISSALSAPIALRLGSSRLRAEIFAVTKADATQNSSVLESKLPTTGQ